MKTSRSTFGKIRTALVARGTAIVFLALAGEVAPGSQIHQAVSSDDFARVKELLMEHPGLVSSVDTNDSARETPLHVAAAKGEGEIATLLLTYQADVNAMDAEGNTPLHYAVINGRKGMAEWLIANGAEFKAKTNNAGETPLHVASSRGYADIVELLLTNQAQVNATDAGGNSPLHWAVLYMHQDVVTLLLRHGAEVNARSSQGPTTFNAYALMTLRLRALRDAHRQGLKGADAAAFAERQTPQDDSLTPLHVAAAVGNIPIAKLLLDYQVEVNAKDGNGWTPLHLAVLCDHKAVAELLRQHGGKD